MLRQQTRHISMPGMTRTAFDTFRVSEADKVQLSSSRLAAVPAYPLHTTVRLIDEDVFLSCGHFWWLTALASFASKSIMSGQDILDVVDTDTLRPK